jgi:hypothetical protein
MTWIGYRKRVTESVQRPRLRRGIGAWFLFVGLSLLFTQVAVAADFNRALIQQFAELGDRSTGTPGCGKAADLIAQGFKDLGIERVGRQRFLLPVTHYQSAYLTVKGQRTPIKPLRLNALSPQTTPDSGLKGPLYYVGSGQLHNFNGIKVEGSIILMELDSGKNWLNAATLGAKALIYVDRGPTTKWNFKDKHELTSVEFPRFWMPVSKARALFGSFEAAEGGLIAPGALLTSSGGWRRVQGENIYALIEGKDAVLREQLLVVEAFYDSTALVPGLSPGADEATSIVALLDLARRLRDHPPGRSVLLMATSGHAQGLAGMRELIWPLAARSKERKNLRRELKARIKRAEEALAALESPVVFEQLDETSAEQLREALAEEIKREVETLSQRLMQLRLEKQADDKQALIRKLADRRFLLRQLDWRGSYQDVTLEGRRVLQELIPAAIRGNQAVLDDAREQLKCIESARRLRGLLSDYALTAFISLHLSSHGDGVGAFNYGWLYDLQPHINRTSTYASIDRILKRCSRQVEEQLGLRSFFRDTLRPSPLRPWQSYLPDHPALGGEVSALAGILGFSLVTTHDGRPLWGTPYDKPENVNWEYLEQQGRLISGLVLKLTQEPELVSNRLPLKGFSTLSGRANFIRQGELFPDQPAPGTLILAYQGPSLFYTMVDTAGLFHVRGLADRKHTAHKAILEGFRFNTESGEIIWAIDKALTGKEAYRVKMRRRFMETDLVMFGCRVTTLFALLEPRTFSYLTKIKLIDGRSEATPLRYWWSRIDTRSSTIANIFLEPITPFKITLSDTVLKRKLVLLNSESSKPEGSGYRVENWPIIPATEYLVARDMWNLLQPRIANLRTLSRH